MGNRERKKETKTDVEGVGGLEENYNQCNRSGGEKRCQELTLGWRKWAIQAGKKGTQRAGGTAEGRVSQEWDIYSKINELL